MCLCLVTSNKEPLQYHIPLMYTFRLKQGPFHSHHVIQGESERYAGTGVNECQKRAKPVRGLSAQIPLPMSDGKQ